MMKSIVFLISILFNVECLVFIKKEFQRPHLQVKTESGTVQGVTLKSENLKNGFYYAFLGIPYAKPPVDDLRYRSPKWVANWPGVLHAGREGSKCVEILLRFVTRNTTITGDEDCLFLNVFTRTNPSRTKILKPVMVFIHGGGYAAGSSDVSIYGPDLLVSKDVLVVTFNYRLGVFGFLSTEDLASPGNYGLKDQNLALRWIQKNIKYFGGDPNNVMLFGQSAGSSSVHFHMLSPKSQGLFHKVLLESGSVLCQWSSQRKPRNMAYLIGLANGITNPKDNQELVDKLRQIDLEDMKQALLGMVVVSVTQWLLTGLPFAPSLEVDHEDAFLTKNNWYGMLKEGNFSHVPVIMGMNSDEALYFYKEAALIQPLFVIFDLDTSLLTPSAMNITDRELSTTVGGLIRDRFFGSNNKISTSDVLDLIRYFTQDQFMRPIWKTAELMSNHIPLYFYYFRYESQLGRNALHRSFPVGLKGVSHGEEVFLIFNEMNNVSKKKSDYLVRERMITMWTNFAKYSNPTPSMRIGNNELENIVWPTVESRNNSQTDYLDIDERLKISKDFEDYKDVLWWNELFNKYANPPYNTY